MLVIILITIFLSLMFGMLGPIVLWLRLSNISDVLAHTLVFSLVISYLTGLNLTIASVFVSAIFVLLLNIARENRDNLVQRMTILGCAAVAFTMILRDVTNGGINIQKFVFGDLFASNLNDLILIILCFTVSAIFVIILHKKIILLSLSEELAKANGINVAKTFLIVTSLLSAMIASSLQVSGILLITSMITIPASVSRLIAFSPYGMILFSMSISLFVGIISIVISILYDISYAPVFAATICVVYYVALLISYFKDAK